MECAKTPGIWNTQFSLEYRADKLKINRKRPGKITIYRPDLCSDPWWRTRCRPSPWVWEVIWGGQSSSHPVGTPPSPPLSTQAHATLVSFAAELSYWNVNYMSHVLCNSITWFSPEMLLGINCTKISYCEIVLVSPLKSRLAHKNGYIFN